MTWCKIRVFYLASILHFSSFNLTIFLNTSLSIPQPYNFILQPYNFSQYFAFHPSTLQCFVIKDSHYFHYYRFTTPAFTMAKRKAPDSTASQADTPGPSQAGDAKPPSLWTTGKPTTPEYYYDGAYPSHELSKSKSEDQKYWPPNFVDLSSV